MTTQFKLTSLLVLLCVVVAGMPASACPRFREASLTQVIGADVAMIGRIVNYDYRSGEGQKIANAIITVQTFLPLRGTLFSEQLIYRENSTFPVSSEWKGDRIVFVAANAIDPEFRRLRGGIVDGSGNEIALKILQPACSGAFIFNASSIKSIISAFLVLATWLFPVFLVFFFLKSLIARRGKSVES